MHKPSLILMTMVAVQSCLFSTLLAAADPDQLSRTELKDKWGQLIYCQRIYRMPEVMPRLYDFDTEQCNAAAKYVTDYISRFSEEQQNALKLDAEKHARAISYNSSEPYQAVPACRKYCQKVAGLADHNNDDKAK